VSDFDGTITTVDVGDEICRRGAPEAFAEFARRWDAGEFTLLEGQAWVWPRVPLTRPELLARVDEVARFRPGFEAFFEAAARRAVPFSVASNGFADYIDHVFARIPAPAPRVFANRFEFLPEGGLRAVFPFVERYGCGACGVCKANIIKELKASGHRVAFIGDGSSDRHAAGHADHTFAVRGGSFERHLREVGAPFEPFEHFDKVRRALELG
jgi:2-hydroxy-3-keto-5-methylthiopentenyl-1-phosphate phosphatase